MKRFFAIITFIIITITSYAQIEISPEWTNVILQYNENNPSTQEDLFEQLTQLYENPININDTSKLNELFILDIFQQQAIKSYIMQYGPLYSIEELHMIHGFDSTTIKLLRPIITINTIEYKQKIKFKNILNHGQHNFIVGSSNTLEKSRGYIEDIYKGGPSRLYYRYYFKYKQNIQLMLSGEKDPGEALFKATQPYGFDFYGYHLLLNDIGRFKRTIIGQYYLQFGQGLTLWTGFNPYTTKNIYHSAQGIKPAGVFTEYNYLNGFASTIALSKYLDITIFYSKTSRDAIKSDSCSTWIQNFYNSGYHRTQNELNKKNLIKEQLWGGNIQYNNNQFHIGVTAQKMFLSKEIHPKSTPYNLYKFKGDHNFNIGIDGSYLWKNLLIFGEIALSQNLGYAGLLGIQLPINSNTKIYTLYRNYQPQYQNIYTTAFGQNTQSQNEKGLYVSLMKIFPWAINTQLSIDFFKIPWLKYQVYGPSRGTELQLSISKEFLSNLHYNIAYKHKEYGHNSKKDNSPNYIINQNHLHRLQSYISFNTQYWQFTFRILNSWFYNTIQRTSSGIFIGQDIQYHTNNPNLAITLRFALFNAPLYNTRLYTVENNLQYEYNTTSFMGKGIRCYIVAHYNINKHLSINAKYSITIYKDKNIIGDGYNAIASNHQQNIKIQLRWKF